MSAIVRVFRETASEVKAGMGSIVRRNPRALAVVAAAIASAIGVPTFATDSSVTIPDIGFNIGDAITSAITSLGAVVLIAVGGWFAFLLVRKGLRWARTALA